MGVTGRLFVSLVLALLATIPAAYAEPVSLRETIVYITAKGIDLNGDAQSESATGFFAGAGGHVVTSLHLLQMLGKVQPGTLEIAVHVGRKSAPPMFARPIDRNIDRDLLILDIDGEPPNGPPCLDPSFVPTVLSTRLFTEGFPGSFAYTTGAGMILSLEGPEGTWITDIDFSAGQSGSPVFTEDGHIIAVAKGQLLGADGRVEPGKYMIVPIADAPGILQLSAIGCGETANEQFELFVRSVYFGATEESVIAALGAPRLSFIPEANPPYSIEDYTSVPEDFDAEGAELSLAGADLELFTTAMKAFKATIAAYVFDDFVAEIVYFDRAVAQYSIVLTRDAITLDATKLSDLLWVAGDDEFAKVASLGSAYFSDFVEACPYLRGAASTRDNWFRAWCPAGTNFDLVLVWTPLGARLSGLGQKDWDETRPRDETNEYNPIGFNWLARWTGEIGDSPAAKCGGGDMTPIVDPEMAAQMAKSLPPWEDESQMMARTCFSLRITQPNGVMASDGSHKDVLSFSNGLSSVIGPMTFSEGAFSYWRYMTRLAAILPDRDNGRT